LIRHLHQHNIPLAIATGSNKESYDLKVMRHQELIGLFHHVVLASSDPEVKQGKPHPDSFLVAARRFEDNPEPDKVILL